MQDELEDMEQTLTEAGQDRAAKQHEIRKLAEEITQQEELINKIVKEKKHLQQCNQKTAEDLQCVEDKCTHLNNLRNKLQHAYDELEDSLDIEKKLREDGDKLRKKIDAEFKLAQISISDMEKNHQQLEKALQRKDIEVSALAKKVEEEKGLASNWHRQIKQFEARVEELDVEFKDEHQARLRVEKAKNNLARELREMSDRLDEAGEATAAQVKVNKKLEAEMSKLRQNFEETKITHEKTVNILRKKHSDAVDELSEEVDKVTRKKAR